MFIADPDIDLLARLPQYSTALQKLYELRLQLKGEGVTLEALQEELVEIEEHLHAYYLDAQVHLRQGLPVQARKGLEKILSGLKIQTELAFILSRTEVPRCFPKKLRQADSAIRKGRVLFHQQAS